MRYYQVVHPSGSKDNIYTHKLMSSGKLRPVQLIPEQLLTAAEVKSLMKYAKATYLKEIKATRSEIYFSFGVRFLASKQPIQGELPL